MRLLSILTIVIAGLVSMPARADVTSDAQAIIRSQTDAFERGDATTAWSYASPAIQGIFGQADLFMGMVKQSYPPIVRHKSFEFGKTRIDGDSVEQDVRIVDDEGVPWEALYMLAKQPDGGWKITGCTLKAVGQAA